MTIDLRGSADNRGSISCMREMKAGQKCAVYRTHEAPGEAKERGHSIPAAAAYSTAARPPYLESDRRCRQNAPSASSFVYTVLSTFSSR